MADAQASAPGAGFSLRAGLNALKRGDIALAVGVLGILVMLLLPMPSWLLDIALAVSIALSALVLMTALFIKTPLEFTTFPAVLLIATMLRLGLNIASTRLILSEGQTGPDAAGEVIAAFGAFVMQGNFVIGLIVFAILVIVNFIVISKWSTRIAEVAARFSLDAMPGKQMAIDADLSAGLIDETQARERRKTVEAESNFFGAMDGASKFVRGDAMAGILITAINIVAGMIIGIAQHGMPAGEAANAYTILTIGDGLVSQIPALIISIAAGLLVSKAGVEGAADQALTGQFTKYPQGLAMVSGVSAAMGLLPGMPLIPFMILAFGAGFAAFTLHRRGRQAEADAADGDVATAEEDAPPAEPTPAEQLAIDDVKVELGYSLLQLVNDAEHQRLTDHIKKLRRALAQDMGFLIPQVRLLDNLQLGAEQYTIKIKEIQAGDGTLRLGRLLAIAPAGAPLDLPGEHGKEPAFGMPATWIEEPQREEATFRGYTVVDPPTVLTTHLTEILREHMPDLLTYAATETLLEALPAEHKALLEDIAPAQINKSGIQRVLQSLLKERVSIRDLPEILEAIADSSAHTKDLGRIVEHVRARLSRQLCWANRAPDGSLPVVTLSPEWEQNFADAMVGEGEGAQFAMAPSLLHQFMQAVGSAFANAEAAGHAPVLLTSPAARPYVRMLAERFRPHTTVMSQNEIHPKAQLSQVGQV